MVAYNLFTKLNALRATRSNDSNPKPRRFWPPRLCDRYFHKLTCYR